MSSLTIPCSKGKLSACEHRSEYPSPAPSQNEWARLTFRYVEHATTETELLDHTRLLLFNEKSSSLAMFCSAGALQTDVCTHSWTITVLSVVTIFHMKYADMH